MHNVSEISACKTKIKVVAKERTEMIADKIQQLWGCLDFHLYIYILRLALYCIKISNLEQEIKLGSFVVSISSKIMFLKTAHLGCVRIADDTTVKDLSICYD